MKLGVCAQALHHLPLREALDRAARLGFEAIELPVDARNPWIELDAALDGGWKELQQAVKNAGLFISAISNHQEGQLLLGPHGSDTDLIHRGTPPEKVRYASERLIKSARLAELLEVPVLIGFVGCEDYSRWFPWPDPQGWEKMGPIFVERMMPLLDQLARLGVSFAHECHPRQLAYNLETAHWVLELLGGHPSFGFNLDPANLMLAGVDPVVFVAELGARVLHVHAKDGELVAHHAARSGLLAHGRWDRKDRGFRFRVPGWGDVSWKRLISELSIAGYRGVLAVEHEDPTMSRIEGLEKALEALSPLVIREAPEARWW